MEHKLIFTNNQDEQAGILLDDNFFNFRIDRLIACKHIIECLCPHLTDRINSLLDRKGTLHVSWKIEPLSIEVSIVKKAWSILNEDSIRHDFYGKEVFEDLGF